MATTTKFWTWTQIYSKMTAELDLEGGDDDFVSESEMMAYANDAIDEAEALIHTIYEDYFLTGPISLTLVSGTDAYSLTSTTTTLYGGKIRGVVYKNGSRVYEVKRIRDWKKFLAYRLGRLTTTTGDLSYFLVNTTPGAPQLVFTPVPQESGTYIEIWHLRQANRLASGSDVVDLPEFVSYVFDFIRERCAYKEAPGSPKHQSTIQDLQATRQLMVDTLTQMVADGDNEIEADLSAYEEHN